MECILIPESEEAVRFWRRKLGTNRIQALLDERRINAPKPGSTALDRNPVPHEMIVELSRSEMQAFYQETALR